MSAPHAHAPTAVSSDDAARVLTHTHEAFVGMDGAGRICGWNAAAEQLFGWPAAEAVGSRLSELIIPAEYRAAHEQGRQMFLDTGIGPILGATIEVEAVTRAGARVPVRLTVSAVPGPGDLAFCGFLADRTSGVRNERVLRASERAAWVLAAAARADGTGAGTVLVDVVTVVGTEMAADVAAWWRSGDDGNLVLDAAWSGTDRGHRFIEASREMRFVAGTGLPGHAASSGEVVWAPDVSTDVRYVRAELARASELHTGILVPVPRRAGVDVLELTTADVREADAFTLAGLRRLGERLGAALDGLGV
jgi:PAS domain S-box-containing protein